VILAILCHYNKEKKPFQRRQGPSADVQGGDPETSQKAEGPDEMNLDLVFDMTQNKDD
jgi:hypothetical protein